MSSVPSDVMSGSYRLIVAGSGAELTDDGRCPDPIPLHGTWSWSNEIKDWVFTCRLGCDESFITLGVKAAVAHKMEDMPRSLIGAQGSEKVAPSLTL